MTLAEFKAWFEGYTEGLEAAPTKAQFDRIKEKVKEISGTPVTYPVYIDRYVEPYRRYWTAGNPFLGATWGGTGGSSISQADAVAYNAGGTGASFDSLAAMHALGKAEALLQ